MRSEKKIIESTIAELDDIIDEIIVDAHGDDEQLAAFHQSFDDQVKLPARGIVAGNVLTVVAIEYDGNARRGITATCRTPNKEHVISLMDVSFPKGTRSAILVNAYRRWMALDPLAVSESVKPNIISETSPQNEKTALEPMDLIVLELKKASVRCLTTGLDGCVSTHVTVRSRDLRFAVPGEIITLVPAKQWQYKNHSYASGKITSTRIDPSALGIAPLRLTEAYMWNPADEYWGEPGEPLLDWTRAVIAQGPRMSYKMEQVLPGVDWEDPDDDPITEANDFKDAGNREAAQRILEDLLAADLRCLDAHCHLGNLLFDSAPALAMRHYEVGKGIGELSLPPDFDGLLLWSAIDNRPYLRCLHGYGLCLWRLKKFEEANAIFQRMLQFNPSDNQGVRFVVEDIKEGKSWESCANQ